MDSPACMSGRGPLTNQNELTGVGYGGRLLNGGGGQVGDVSHEDPSAALLRTTLLQLQRALTQNASLSDALRDALAGEERTTALLRQHKEKLEEAAARSSAASERARSQMEAEVEALKKAAAKAKETADAECSKVRDLEFRLKKELQRKEEALEEMSRLAVDHKAKQEECKRLAAAMAEAQRETEERGEAQAKLESELHAARKQIEQDAMRRKELEVSAQQLREEVAAKDRFLESELAEKDITFQQQLVQQEANMQAELSRRDEQIKKAVAQHQEALKEMERNHQASCQRLVSELQAEAIGAVKAVEEELQRQTASAEENAQLIKQLQQECMNKEKALQDARKEAEAERAAKEEQARAAEAAIASLRHAVAERETEMHKVQDQTRTEVRKRLDAKERQVDEMLLQRKAELKQHREESEQLQQRLAGALKEVETLRTQQAQAIQTAQQRDAELAELHCMRKQLEKRLLQMQIEGHRASRTRSAIAGNPSPDAAGVVGISQPEAQTPRQPVKQRRREAQLQVEWADHAHAALTQQASEGKQQLEVNSTPNDEKRGEAVSPKATPARGRGRSHRSALAGNSEETSQCGQSQQPRTEHSQADGQSQVSFKSDESAGLGEEAMQTEEGQEGESGYARRHSLRIRKQKSDFSPPSGTSNSSPPKPTAVSKKK